MSDFNSKLLKIVQEDWDDDAVEVISYEDAGYGEWPADYCGEGTCFDEDWGVKITYRDEAGKKDFYLLRGSLPDLLERLK